MLFCILYTYWLICWLFFSFFKTVSNLLLEIFLAFCYISTASKSDWYSGDAQLTSYCVIPILDISFLEMISFVLILSKATPERQGGTEGLPLSSGQLLSRVWLFVTLWAAAHQGSLSITSCWSQTQVHWVGDAIQHSHLLLSPSPPALSLSQHQELLQRVTFSHQWPKFWSFSFSISPSSEYSGLISFRMD